MIFASSGGAGYGECAEPATEETPFLPLSPYGIAKKCGEEYLAGWNRIHDTSHVSLRFANVYGPRQDAGLEGGVVAIFLERLARGDETVIYGDGEQCRDFVYVADIVSALVAADGPKRRPVQRRQRRRDERGAGCFAACAAVAGSDAEAPAGPGAARRRPPFGPRRVADRARARLARGGDARRRARADLGLDEGSSGGVAKSSGAMDAPLPAPEMLIRPWRTATLVASLVAAVELVLLLIAAVLLLAKPLSHAMQRHAEAAAFSTPKKAAKIVPHVKQPVAKAEADARRRRTSGC